ncbi:MAG: hypothetical protein HOH74_14120 [Gemmatimonadetes bacterium]|jgi:flagellar hook assembly protein FlgD|nr:hypothetical protein [Gemmatimonadota bacterium]
MRAMNCNDRIVLTAAVVSLAVLACVPSEQEVSLRVYGVSGQAVRTLVDGHRRPGTHVVRWDGKGDDGRAVASGVYLVSLGTATLRRSSRMILLR